MTARFSTLLLFCFSCAIQAQTSRPSEPQGTLSGRVTAQGKALAGSVVLLWKQPMQEPLGIETLSGLTDTDGNYRISNVPPGNYYASVTAPGFFLLEDGRPSRQLRPVVITGSDSIDKIDFQLQRGGVVTGRVVTLDEKPLPEITVVLLPETAKEPSYNQPRKRPDSVKTDDRGIYRIFGITPGRYRVAAGDLVTAYASNNGKPAITRTFYPNLVEESKAPLLEIKTSQVWENINIKSGLPQSSFSIVGKVVDDQSGMPIPNAACGIDIYGNGEIKGGISGLNFTNARGEFVVDGLTAGTYRISVPSHLTFGTAEPPEYFGSSEDIEVVDHDVESVIVKVSRTATLSGTVRFEGANEPSLLAKLQSVRVNLFTTPGPGKEIFFQRLVINKDGSFSMRGVRPGTLGMSLNQAGVGASNSFRISRIERAGVASEDIQITAGAEVTDLTVVMAYVNSSIHGTVKAPTVEPGVKLSGQVYLYSEKTVIGFAQIDERGEFLIQDTPSGTFRLVADIQVAGSKPLRTEQFVTVTAGATVELILTPIRPN
ncbi:MAG TPA: carboxypeptidase-like regulatory domain-containing protein [Pyrinomonadaceae bacterium]|nr:carboxypeptidase-like regulatory domain-containing protein [Pyrinomonadaceae bacterium]